MKFQNFYFENELHYGVVQDEKLYDLSQVPAAPRSLKDWIECGNPVDQLDSWLKEAPVVPKEQIQPAPAAVSPEKIFCIGLNYRAHAAESGGQLPAFPEVFSKFSNALAAHGQTVRLSPYAGQVDYEAELVVIIGKTCRDVGFRKRYDDKCKNDPIWLAYNRAYKTHYARYLKKKMTTAQFEQWSRYAVELRQKAETGEMELVDYQRELRV